MNIEQESKRLRALTKLNVLDTNPDPLYDKITDLVADMFDAPISFISMVDKDRLFFKSSHGTDLREIDRQDTFCSQVIDQEQALIVEDASKDPRFQNAPAVKDDPKFRFYAGVPLTTKQGFIVGTLCFVDTKVKERLSESKQAALQSLADLAINIMELRADHTHINSLTGLPSELVAMNQLEEWVNS